MLPGTRLLAIARLVLEPETIARVLEPLVADWQREWLVADSMAERVSTRLRGTCAFTVSSFTCLTVAPGPGALYRTALGTYANFTVFLVALVLVPNFVSWHPWPTELGLLVVTFLSTSVIFATLPMAMRLSAHSGSRTARRRALLLATASSMVLVVAFLGWLAPAARRARDEAQAAASHERVAAVHAWHLTLPELYQATPSATPHALSAHELSSQRHAVAAYVTAPLVLGFLGWRLGGRARRSSLLTRTAWGFTAFFTYNATVAYAPYALGDWQITRQAAVWLPLAAWVIAAILLQRSPRPNDSTTEAIA